MVDETDRRESLRVRWDRGIAAEPTWERLLAELRSKRNPPEHGARLEQLGRRETCKVRMKKKRRRLTVNENRELKYMRTDGYRWYSGSSEDLDCPRFVITCGKFSSTGGTTCTAGTAASDVRRAEPLQNSDG